MMTNERQVTVYHLDTRRQDRQFHPYRRPVGYDRFTSVPQMSAERQWMMSFIVVSMREVMGTSQFPLSTLWFWPQEETASRILCRTSYFHFIRRNRRYHPYKRAGKYSSGLCKCCSLPLYLDCRYFSLSVRRYLDDTEASTTAATSTEIECLAVDNQMEEETELSKEDNYLPDAKMTQDVQITSIKTPEMTTLELDKPTSDDVSDPNITDIPVIGSMTDWDLNLLTDSDLQQMGKTACDTTVADLGSSAESKTNTDVTHTHVYHKQVSNVTSDDQLATTNVSTNETPEVQQIPPQNKAPVLDTVTALTNETYEKHHENDKIDTECKKRDNEDDCHKMNPTEEKLLYCGQSSSVSSVHHLEKTKEEMYDKKSVDKSFMDETHKGKDTESRVRCIIPPKACKKRMSAAMFFQKEISQSETSNPKHCTDFNLASSSITQASGLKCYESRKSQCQQAQIADAEIHSNNSLCIWLRKSTSSSEPSNDSKKLSDEERLRMRKRRFGITAQSEEKSTKKSKRDMSGSVHPVITKRRKNRLNRY